MLMQVAASWPWRKITSHAFELLIVRSLFRKSLTSTIAHWCHSILLINLIASLAVAKVLYDHRFQSSVCLDEWDRNPAMLRMQTVSFATFQCTKSYRFSN